MEKVIEEFESLVSQIAETSYAITDDLFSEECLTGLYQQILYLFEEDQLKNAGIGQLNQQVDKKIRGDQIKWLPKESVLSFETEFNLVIHSFMEYVNRTCFLSLNDFEFHYTCYPKGTYYKKHIDQFKNDNSRLLSFILYLNPNWQASDGGEISIYPEEGDAITIAPKWGRVVCFKSSELMHEVLTTNKNRLSVTGWLKSINGENILQLID